jgi:hypothetical protein
MSTSPYFFIAVDKEKIWLGNLAEVRTFFQDNEIAIFIKNEV